MSISIDDSLATIPIWQAMVADDIKNQLDSTVMKCLNRLAPWLRMHKRHLSSGAMKCEFRRLKLRIQKPCIGDCPYRMTTTCSNRGDSQNAVTPRLWKPSACLITPMTNWIAACTPPRSLGLLAVRAEAHCHSRWEREGVGVDGFSRSGADAGVLDPEVEHSDLSLLYPGAHEHAVGWNQCLQSPCQGLLQAEDPCCRSRRKRRGSEADRLH